MPGSVHSDSIFAGAASLATVLAGLWIADRLLSPIRHLKDCRREVQASIVVAFSLRDTVARLAGIDDIDALDALTEARRDLREEAGRLEALARRRSPFLRLYVRIRGYRLMQAAHGLKGLSESLVAQRGRGLMDRAKVETALRFGRGRRSGAAGRRHSELIRS